MEQYTVSSNGVPIGVTDLGFARTDGFSRWGWFAPNDEGERLMPIVTGMHRALRTSVHRPRPGLEVIVYSMPPAGDPGTLAALEDALARVESLSLTLHRADGTVIPTQTIGIQDVAELMELDEHDEGPFDFLGERWADGLDEETRAAIEHDVGMVLDDIDWPEGADDYCDDFDFAELTSGREIADFGVSAREPWMAEQESSATRYQIHVRLVNEWDVP